MTPFWRVFRVWQGWKIADCGCSGDLERIQAYPLVSGVPAKVAAPKERPLFVLGKLLDRLALQKPPRNTQRTESGAKQHCCGAPVRNLTSWAKEDPPGKAMP
jgi:hypothetical protein